MWLHIIKILYKLQLAFSNKRAFFWAVIVVIGFCTRLDRLGTTSFIRSIGLKASCYNSLNNFFHSSSASLPVLTSLWMKLVVKIFFTFCYRVNGRLVLIGDGIKVAKEAKKMPAVKSLHQESQNNSKPSFIMGHSIQAISLLVGKGFSFFAVPLVARIHEGIKLTNFKGKTLIDKMGDLISMFKHPCYVVLDAYYRNAKLAKNILKHGSDLIVRLKTNAVAYIPLPVKPTGKPGRPRKYGEKIKLVDIFKTRLKEFTSVNSPVYGETNIKIQYFTMNLMWPTLGKIVKFIWVKHPTRGRMILLATDLELQPIDIIKLYGFRFKIEVSFKMMTQLIGTFSYHFWMRTMKPIKRRSKGQYLHRSSKEYREKVQRKLNAYHLHIQLGLIAQGVMQYLSIVKTDLVWGTFRGYIRTIRKNMNPSEMIVGMALRESFSEFFHNKEIDENLKKFIASKMVRKEAFSNKDYIEEFFDAVS